MAEESDSTRDIRRAVCCQLAEALLHSCSDGKYSKPDPIEISTNSARGRVGTTRFSSSSGMRTRVTIHILYMSSSYYL